MILRYIPYLIKGYWSLWGLLRVSGSKGSGGVELKSRFKVQDSLPQRLPNEYSAKYERLRGGQKSTVSVL